MEFVAPILRAWLQTFANSASLLHLHTKANATHVDRIVILVPLARHPQIITSRQQAQHIFNTYPALYAQGDSSTIQRL